MAEDRRRMELDAFLDKVDGIVQESISLIRDPDVAEARWSAEREAKKVQKSLDKDRPAS